MKVALWAEIRRLSEIEKLSGWAIARRLHCSRHTVAAALKLQQPPSSQAARRASLLDPYVEQKRNQTTLSQAMGLAGRGYRRPTGAACAPRHEGAGGANVALSVSACCWQRRARAAWYSRSRARRPRKVPRNCHLRSRSTTRRTA